MIYFIAHSYQHRQELQPAISAVKELLDKRGDMYMVYTEVQNAPKNVKELMRNALKEVRNTDALIAEMSHKEEGVGIEMGVASALNLPIFGIRKAGSEPSTTMEGVLTVPIVEYNSPQDLTVKLNTTLSSEFPADKEGNKLNSENRAGPQFLHSISSYARSIIVDANLIPRERDTSHPYYEYMRGIIERELLDDLLAEYQGTPALRTALLEPTIARQLEISTTLLQITKRGELGVNELVDIEAKALEYMNITRHITQEDEIQSRHRSKE